MSHPAPSRPLLPQWQRELAQAIRDPAELLALLELDPSLLSCAQAAAKLFPLRVPRDYVARMRRGDPSDPLLRQVLPLGLETEAHAGYGEDPVGDRAAMRSGGVIHKYHGRALLVATGACAVHCRYCFRRHFPYQQANAGEQHWRGALTYLREHEDISEVILSGGDPLVLNDRRLSELAHALTDIPHIKRLRVHSRLPIVLPSRVTDEMLEWLGGTRLRTVLVVHANHANELSEDVGGALRAAREAGITVLNQSVLLAGVNDSAPALNALSFALFEHGALPYYLHVLDRVAGAAHFDLDEPRAKALWAEMAASLPGYLVPKLVREEAGKHNKTLLAP